MALTPEQQRVLRELTAAPSFKRASPKSRKALIAAALVESNLSTPNQANSDRDSEGALQQRPSQGWGPTSETNTKDAEQFLKRAIPIAGKYGSAGQLAQAVQRSAFPGRYDERGGQAEQLLKEFAGGFQAAKSSGGSTRTITTPGVDNSQQRRNTIAQFLLAPKGQQDPLQLAAGLQSLPDTPGTSKTVRTAGTDSTASVGRGNAKITGPNPGRIQPGVKNFMRQISAVRGGRPVVGSDGTGHSKLTVNGNVSDHFSGNASDIPAAGQELINLGQAALIAAGMPRAQARKQRGGLYNVNGHQIIFATNEGGNHHDHLHVSARGR